ncbi:MAG: polyphosphate:AMP phosphotransferase [Clostridiales bacterium]|jgi:polyphosphate:AMP phosphotransferase|nr:polyphosphate:AMP phosphotransferase [Clostridiales bacterium]
MLDKIDLSHSMARAEYRREMKILEKRMAGIQQPIKDFGIPVMIVFEGWSAAGKGTLISRILYPLDPRQFNVHTMGKTPEEWVMRPFLWPYWTRIPAKGRISIFDKSWHRVILPEYAQRWRLSAKAKSEFYYDVNAFEQQLRDDGIVIIKLFLHISKEAQRLRFKELEKNPGSAWRVDEHDWEQNKNYGAYLKRFDEMINHTNYSGSRWSVIESDDSKYATVKSLNIISERIEEEIKRLSETETKPAQPEPPIAIYPQADILGAVDLSKSLGEKEYKERVEKLQARISELGYKLYKVRKSVIIVYEGWDAAGKGGNIKRLTERLDPRAYEVIPIGSPSAEELAHHYMWRFMNKMPKDGHMAIFDRSWYGRVMVERIERFTPPERWQGAYQEINDVERHLANHGSIIFKFWLHIDKSEQLARFEARQKDPVKQYKITDEDWRNREKWDQYENAIDEMLLKTDTEYAPWTIVESNDKKHARVKALEIVVNELEKQLD